MSFICTANRARSPFAAELLRRCTVGLPITVASYGTLDHGGAPALPEAVRAARAFGVDLTSHRAMHAAPGLLQSSDLIIGFEHSHVAYAVVTGGADRSETFLLSELTHVCAQLVQEPFSDVNVRAAVARAHKIRSGLGEHFAGIDDPAGRPERRFVETYGVIEHMVGLVATRLLGATSS